MGQRRDAPWPSFMSSATELPWRRRGNLQLDNFPVHLSRRELLTEGFLQAEVRGVFRYRSGHAAQQHPRSMHTDTPWTSGLLTSRSRPVLVAEGSARVKPLLEAIFGGCA